MADLQTYADQIRDNLVERGVPAVIVRATEGTGEIAVAFMQAQPGRLLIKLRMPCTADEFEALWRKAADQ